MPGLVKLMKGVVRASQCFLMYYVKKGFHHKSSEDLSCLPMYRPWGSPIFKLLVVAKEIDYPVSHFCCFWEPVELVWEEGERSNPRWNGSFGMKKTICSKH